MLDLAQLILFLLRSRFTRFARLELFGQPAVTADRKYRLHRFREVARRVVAKAPPEERELLKAYVEGVNAGLGALGKPWEHTLLRVQPRPWSSEDTVLVLLSMFLDLEDPDGSRESALGLMHDLLPPAMVNFLSTLGTEWDAPWWMSRSPRQRCPGRRCSTSVPRAGRRSRNRQRRRRPCRSRRSPHQRRSVARRDPGSSGKDQAPERS